MKRRHFVKTTAAIGAAMIPLQSLLARRMFGQVAQALPLPGNKIPQFVDPLPLLGTPTAQGGSMEVLVNDGNTNAIFMREFNAHVLPTGLFAPGAKPVTTVWGYRLGAAPTLADTYLGPVIVAQRSDTTKRPTKIRWVNSLGGADTSPAFWTPSTDLSLHWADPHGDPMMITDPVTGMMVGNPAHYGGPIPVVPHLHGGEVPPQLDGGPDAWFLSNTSPQTGYTQYGHAYYTSAVVTNANEAIYHYPNSQEAANIWFHDHALGITRLNVYAGLAGGYILYDGANAPPGDLGGVAGAAKIIPLIIQDRMFDVTGQLFFPNVGLNPEHPWWVPEFVGDVICVNGKSWPYLTVNQKRYRFLFLDGSNARFYDMSLIDPMTGVKGPPMYVIGTDGGYLNTPVLIDPNATGNAGGIAKSLVMGPGERYDVIIDFGDTAWLARIAAAYGGTVPNEVRLQLRNTAKTPFPGGAPAMINTTGRVMEFRVNRTATGTPPDITYDPATTPALRTGHAIVGITGATPDVTRQLTLNEAMGPGGPLEVLVNNTKWNGLSVATDVFPGNATHPAGWRPDFGFESNGNYYSELPEEGKTELWEIINLTADAHPIHLHLVQFQLVNRQAFDVRGYTAAYNALFPASTAIDPMTGMAYPGGMFIGGYGPPLNYNTGNPSALGGNPAVTPFLNNAKRWPVKPPLQQEQGWKDTVIMYPGEVTRIMVRWAPTDVASGDTTNNHFPFDPNGGHGFVWHCHIIDHEDNEMMRPDLVQPKAGVTTRTYVKGTDY